MKEIIAAAVLAATAAGGGVDMAVPALAAPAPGPRATLVADDAGSVRVGQSIDVGVWAQLGAPNRTYTVAVYSPSGHRVLYAHGTAPMYPAGWKNWFVRATQPGSYRTVYYVDGTSSTFYTHAS